MTLGRQVVERDLPLRRAAGQGAVAAGDLAIAAAALWIAFELRVRIPLPFTHALLPADRIGLFFQALPVALGGQITLLYFFGLYDRRPLARSEILARLVGALGVLAAGLVAWHYFADRALPRSVLMLFIGLDGLLLFLFRWLVQRLPPVGERRVAIVGRGAAAREVASGIATRKWHGLAVHGHVAAPGEDDGPAPPAPELGPALGTVDDLPRLLAEGIIDDIILAPSAASWQTTLVDRLAESRPGHASVLLLPGPFESLIGQMRYRWVHDIPLIEVMRESDWSRHRPLKRLLDLSGAAVLLLLALPLMLGTALWIKLRAGGAVVYRQTRIGRAQRPFTLYKFRTMRPDAEPAGELLAIAGDPRFIPGGALVRALRLDELPQLLNVLDGSMSLVGPRPERPGFVATYLETVPGYAERFVVQPGLTGLAQVNGDYHSSAANKLRYDLAYIANAGLWLDLSILFRTVKIVLGSRGI